MFEFFRYDTNRVSIRFGSINIYAGGTITDAEYLKCHEQFNGFINDIVLIKLTEKIVKSEKVDFISISDSPAPNGFVVTFAGWGSKNIDSWNSYRLQKGQGTILSDDQCDDEIGYGYENIICISSPIGQGICKGDAGAPAVANNKAYGIAIFSVGSCGTYFSDGYCDLSKYKQWITDNSI